MSKKSSLDEIIELFFILLIIPFIPFILLFFVFKNIKEWFEIRTYVCKNIDLAWNECCDIWKKSKYLHYYADHVEEPMEHKLAVYLGKNHQKKSSFFLEQLNNPNPLLAAYAFKCLIRAKENLEIIDIPEHIFNRKEEIIVLWADLVDKEILGEHFKKYFLIHASKELKKYDIPFENLEDALQKYKKYFLDPCLNKKK